MADSFVQLPSDGTGKKLATQSVQRGADLVHFQEGMVGALAPAMSILTFANLGAGSSVFLDAAVIPAGKVGKLLQVTLACSTAAKFVIAKRDGAVVTTIDVILIGGFGGNSPVHTWIPPARDFATLAGNGIDENFRVTATNLDGLNAADVYATLYWDEV